MGVMAAPDHVALSAAAAAVLASWLNKVRRTSQLVRCGGTTVLISQGLDRPDQAVADPLKINQRRS